MVALDLRYPLIGSEIPGLNQKASVQVGNKSKTQYLLLITESKADFSDMSLAKHHGLTREAMLKKMTNSSATEPVSVRIGGHSALQDEIRGTQAGTNIVFLHTTIDDGEYYQQVLAWSSKSHWPEATDRLHKITETFRSGGVASSDSD